MTIERSSAVRSATERAYGKINLGLKVLGVRPDGWHTIDSLIVPIDLADTVSVESADEDGAFFDGPFAGDAPVGADNSVLAALRAFGERVAKLPFPVAIRTRKEIPAEAGLGGGSTDAAAVLRILAGFARLEGIPYRKVDLLEAAASVGSDVVPLVEHGWWRVGGTGTERERIAGRTIPLVLALLGRCSTKEVYAGLENSDMSGDRGYIGTMIAEFGSSMPDLRAGNDLEASALRADPALAESAKRLRESVPLSWCMTGSGGCFFAFCTSAREAEAAAARLSDAGITAWPSRTLPDSMWV